MVVEDVSFRTRRELEKAGLSVEAAAYLVDDHPPGGWDSVVTKDVLRAELSDLRSELKDAIAKQTWRLAILVVGAQGVVVAAIAVIAGR